jgi:arginase
VTLRFLLVPQWQGSPSPRAMRLAEGVAALRTDLPSSATTEIAVPLEAGDDQGTGIARYSSLRLVRDRITAALADVDGPAVIVGGDCAVSAAGIEAAVLRHPDACVVWFDAHPDLNSPDSSPSGAFSGMVLRAAIDAGEIAASRVVLAGARSWDVGERAFADEVGLRSLTVDELADAPALVAAITALRARFPLAGASLSAYAPSAADTEQAADDAATILRVVAALG